MLQFYFQCSKKPLEGDLQLGVINLGLAIGLILRTLNFTARKAFFFFFFPQTTRRYGKRLKILSLCVLH